MKKKIGFVLNAPIKYSETFLLQEFKLLKDAGFDICIFEGYNQEISIHRYSIIKSLPNNINECKNVLHIFSTIFRLFTRGFIPLIKFVYFEARSGTDALRICKRIWFNAHILSAKVDFLHFCFAEIAIQKELAAKAIDAKMSVSIRGSDILIYPHNKQDCYNRLWKYADKIHAVSKWIYKNAIQLGLSKEKPCTIIHDGININQITFNNSGLHNPIRILSVGRLVSTKNYPFALKVIAELIHHNIPLQYSIIGDGSLKADLLSLIKELKIEDYVQLKGAYDHRATLDFMGNSDLFLHTSQSEGLGVALLEAQASGLLTIALSSGGTEENIEDKLSGWIIKKCEPSFMAKIIIDIINLSPEEKLKVKNYARQRIEKKFNLQSYISTWKKFFHE